MISNGTHGAHGSQMNSTERIWNMRSEGNRLWPDQEQVTLTA